ILKLLEERQGRWIRFTLKLNLHSMLNQRRSIESDERKINRTMTGEEMERAMDFILKQQANLVEQQAKTDAELGRMRGAVTELTTNVNRLAVEAEADRLVVREGFDEIREAIGKLIDVVENTRDFAEEVGRLAVASEKRLTKLEERIDTIEGRSSQS